MRGARGPVLLLCALLIALVVLLPGCPGLIANISPQAVFTATPTSGSAPLVVYFDASGSSDPDGNIQSYEWNFGDGNTGSGQTTTHSYYTDATFTVILTVIDDDGDSDSASTIVVATPQGLVTWFELDEASGSTAYDSSGNGNHGAIQGATYTNGVSGSSLQFDGMDDEVIITHSPVQNVTHEITLEAWVSFSTTTDYMILVSKFGSYHIDIDKDNFAEVAIWAGGVKYELHGTKTQLDDGEWHYIAGGYDGSMISLYVDGKQEEGRCWSSVSGNIPCPIEITTAVDQTSNPIYIGRWQVSVAHRYKGAMDEVRIYSRALSANEINARYEATKP